MYLVQDANGYVWDSLSVIDDSRWFCPQLHVWASRDKLVGPLRRYDYRENAKRLCLSGAMDMKLIDAMEKADRWVQQFEEFLHDNALAC